MRGVRTDQTTSADRPARPALLRRVALRVSLLAVACLLATSCATGSEAEQQKKQEIADRRPGQTDLMVESFLIQGVESFPVRKVKNGLATRKDPGWRSKIPFIGPDRSYFNILDWEKDLDRIRTFYRSRGYFDMQIVRQTVDRNYKEGTVELFLEIDEGERVTVETINVEGLSSAEAYDGESLLEGLPLQEGGVFTQTKYLQTKSRMVDRLERQGYAYANVEGKTYVYPGTSRARVRFIADPGPQAVFGEIRIKGLETIPKRHVRQVVPFEPGDPYSSAMIQEAQQSIYRLQVFRLVSVLPAHQTDEADGPKAAPAKVVAGREPEIESSESSGGGAASGISSLLHTAQKEAEKRTQLTPRVPVVVRLEEARMWNVRLGAGAAIESTRQDSHVILDISSRNFLGGLRKMHWTNEVGYAWAPGLVFGGENRAARQGIILSSQLEFIQPWLRQEETNIRFEPTLERDVQIGYLLWNPGARLSVDRKLFDHLTVGGGYRVSYYSFSFIDQSLTTETPLGQDFQPEFLLEYLEETLTLDYRDNPLNPKRGFVAEATAQQAGDYLFGGEFNYLKFRASVKGYIPFQLGTKWVLGLKWAGGSIYNFEPVPEPQTMRKTQRVPTISRFYGGGKGSVRSLGRRELSLYRGSVPVGGNTMVEMSVEPRFRLVRNLFGIGDIWGATFLDAGTVLPGQFAYQTPANRDLQLGTEGPKELTNSLMYGAGLGVWWVTPIGPVRFDFAYTLNDFDVRRCANDEIVITGNPDCNRIPRGASPLSDSLNRFNFIIGIGHSF